MIQILKADIQNLVKIDRKTHEISTMGGRIKLERCSHEDQTSVRMATPFSNSENRTNIQSKKSIPMC